MPKKTIRRFSTWPLADHLAVIDNVSRELHILNATAATIWHLLEDGGLSQDDLCLTLADLYGVERSIIELDVGACLAGWRALEWIDEDGAALQLRRMEPDVAPYGNVHPPTDGIAPPDGPVISHRLLLPSGKTVSCHIGQDGPPSFQDMTRRLRHILSGMIIIAGPETGPLPAHDLALMTDGQRVWVRNDDQWLWSTDNTEMLSRFLHELVRAAYAADQSLLAIMHAGLVGKDGGCIVLPGISGAGKSTLTGWLASHGWYFGGDDIIGLAAGRDGLLALPFPTALAVKNGSWPILAAHYPSLMAQPVIPCAARDARYMPLPRHRQIPWTTSSRKVRAIVFPRYEAGSPATAVPIDLQEGLTLLSASGITTGDHLDADLLQGLFAYLEELPIFRLTYGDLQSAQPLLEAMLAGDA